MGYNTLKSTSGRAKHFINHIYLPENSGPCLLLPEYQFKCCWYSVPHTTEKTQSDMMKSYVVTVTVTSSFVCPFGLLNSLKDGMTYFIWPQMRRELVKTDPGSDIFTMNFVIQPQSK
ncbi:hypothetical protein BDF21DRAFT_401803 [Thamnidium elegans]|nr:hypothetical protein BDF21DRAFT_401803 [Thamnidium elegans]